MLFKDFPAYAKSVTQDLHKHVKDYAASLGRPVIYVNSARESKEEIATRVMSEKLVKEGLICVITAVETCRTLEPVKDKATGLFSMRLRNRKCLFYYFYLLDKEFGFMFFKLESWFPFNCTVYLNGREMLRKKLDEAGIKYAMYDNSFSDIDDVAKAQELADKISDDSRGLSRKLDHLAQTFNPYLKTYKDAGNEGCRWYIQQFEYATDIMFRSREDLEDIYPSLVGFAFHDLDCKDTFSFLGRKPASRFNGEAVADYKNRPVGWRVKFKINSNHIKFYDKWNCLRIELTINNPYEFKVMGAVRHRDGTESRKWKPMGKGLANLCRFAQVGRECDNRMIAAMNDISPHKSVIETIASASSRARDGERSVPGFNVWRNSDYLLFKTIGDGRYLVQGFCNRDIRDIVHPEIKDEKKEGRGRAGT